ncbi:RNA polymerase sigma factor [Virgisporangium ochraceum]|nr:sigma-70 family RNA polymerase sigma factor [Virgisporangium ochraceum]
MLGDDDAADEVVSDTIAAACRFDDQPERHLATRMYLARSVYHRCLGLLATYERFMFDSGRENRRRLRVSTMSDTQRAVVALVMFGDHDLTQTAATLNLSPATVTRHLRDATSALLGVTDPVGPRRRASTW